MTHPSQPDWRRSFGRRQGRALGPRKQSLLENAGELLLPSDDVQQALAKAWDHYPTHSLEIGFGGGEFLAAMALRHPSRLHIGCEPFINGVVKLLDAADRHQLTNLRILPDDARLVMDALPDASLDQIYILFPDPWPKKRHHERRIIRPNTIAKLARILKPGCELLLATDHIDYAGWMLQHMLASPAFAWQAQSQRDWTEPPEDWTTTRYEYKTSAEGRAPVFYRFSRRF